MWVIVLDSVAVAIRVCGASGADVPPALFAIVQSLIWGTAAYVACGPGWVVRVCLVGTDEGIRSSEQTIYE